MKSISKIQSASKKGEAVVLADAEYDQRVDVIKRVLQGDLPPECLTDADIILMQELVMDAVVRKKALSSEMAFEAEESPSIH